jgi:hypothetical protein
LGKWGEHYSKISEDGPDVTSVPEPIRQNRPAEVDLCVSRYDQVAGMLVSLLILIGCAVGTMFIIWLTTTLVFRQDAVPIEWIESPAGRGANPPGFERDMLAPGMEEMPELAEPQLETALEAVTNTVSSLAAFNDVLNTTSSNKGDRGRGDKRPPGPEGEGDNVIPRWERWEVRWVSSGIQAYARQLDFFKIELGAGGGGSALMDYAYELSKSPKKRQGTSKAEERLFMTWKGGTLQQFDRTLLRRAGIDTNNKRVMFQFFPEQVEESLAQIEKANADKLGHLSDKEYLKTIFGVRAKRRQYEFFVAEQRFRPVPP